MPYITIVQSPRFHQISFDDIIAGVVDMNQVVIDNHTNTRTRYVKDISIKMLEQFNFEQMLRELKLFNTKYEKLSAERRENLYHTYHIPKRSGGIRRIDEPLPPLMSALRELKDILEKSFFAKYHTAAYAYVRGRSTIHAVKKHQQNESQWFLKMDLTNFFGSTSFDFTMKQLKMIFPFSEVVKLDGGEKELAKAIDLCFLNGGLPQGTPISPMLTNLVMIPIDHYLFTTLRKYDERNFVYTRYADDMLISCKVDFDWRKIQSYINEIFDKFETPYLVNEKKTHYGSRAGSNWNLGVMLNKDNVITIGHKNKKLLRAMVDHYLKDRMNGVKWPLNDMQVLSGHLNYHEMVEGERALEFLDVINKKYSANLKLCLKKDIGAAMRGE